MGELEITVKALLKRLNKIESAENSARKAAKYKSRLEEVVADYEQLGDERDALKRRVRELERANRNRCESDGALELNHLLTSTPLYDLEQRDRRGGLEPRAKELAVAHRDGTMAYELELPSRGCYSRRGWIYLQLREVEIGGRVRSSLRIHYSR